MSLPFGPCCKLSEYLAWALTQKCEVKHGIAPKFEPLVKIIAPSGRWAIVYNKKPSDSLPHRYVATLDRNLGLESPFPKTPEPSE